MKAILVVRVQGAFALVDARQSSARVVRIRDRRQARGPLGNHATESVQGCSYCAGPRQMSNGALSCGRRTRYVDRWPSQSSVSRSRTRPSNSVGEVVRTDCRARRRVRTPAGVSSRASSMNGACMPQRGSGASSSSMRVPSRRVAVRLRSPSTTSVERPSGSVRLRIVRLPSRATRYLVTRPKDVRNSTPSASAVFNRRSVSSRPSASSVRLSRP